MRFIALLRLRLRALWSGRRAEAELDEEMRYHFERQIQMYLESGLSRREALERARREFGGLEQHKEECRDATGVRWLAEFGRDVVYGWRNLRRSPGFTAVAALSLALGIGANAALFSLINALVLRPLPVEKPGELVEVSLNGPFGFSISYPLFQVIQRHSRSFVGVFASAPHKQYEVQSGGREVRLVSGELVSGDYFRILGVGAQLGRTLSQKDDSGSLGEQSVVLSDQYWAQEFNRKPQVIGSPLRVNGKLFTVVGVLPRSFFGTDVTGRPEIFLPLLSDRLFNKHSCLDSKSCWWLVVMARLRPGVTIGQARAELGAISRAEIGQVNRPGWDSAVMKRARIIAEAAPSGFSFFRTRMSKPLVILMALVGMVLLIACANLASLLMARSAARQREIMVRLALGAGRAQIVRLLLTENLLISVIGGIAGFVCSLWVTKVLASALSTQQSKLTLDTRPDWRVFAFLMAAILGTAILFGILPALRVSRVSIEGGLREASRTVQGGLRRKVLTHLSLGAQVAFSLVLLMGASLFAGSLRSLRQADLGFDPRGVVAFSLDLGRRPEKGDAIVALLDGVLERVKQLPGVANASYANVMPLCHCGWTNDIAVPGQPKFPDAIREAHMNEVAPEYFRLMGIRILQGREFRGHEINVVVLSKRAADAYFPHGNALGNAIAREFPANKLLRVIGIVADTKYMDVREDYPRTVYVPYVVDPLYGTIFVKASGAVAPVVPAVRALLGRMLPTSAVPEAQSMESQVDGDLILDRLMAGLTLFFAALALLLTAIGLYGTLAYAVARRTAEIGVRMSLGAQRPAVLRMILSENMGAVLFGLAAGLVAVFVSSRLVASLLYGVSPDNPVAVIASVSVLIAVAVFSSMLPALRAARIDPIEALRWE